MIEKYRMGGISQAISRALPVVVMLVGLGSVPAIAQSSSTSQPVPPLSNVVSLSATGETDVPQDLRDAPGTAGKPPHRTVVKIFDEDGIRSEPLPLCTITRRTDEPPIVRYEQPQSDGVATPCPNIWFHKMGNLVEEGWKDALDQVNDTPFYDLLLSERPRLDACKGCFTPWDTLSMYFEGAISLDDLCRAPSYAPQGIRHLLETRRAQWRAALTALATLLAAAGLSSYGVLSMPVNWRLS